MTLHSLDELELDDAKEILTNIDDNVYYVEGPITNKNIAPLYVEIKEAIDKKVPEFIIMITTIGGEADVILSICELMMSSKDTKFITCGVGKCLSAGAVLLLSGQERYVHRTTLFMMHPAQFSFDTNSSTKIASRLEAENKSDALFYEQLSKNCGIDISPLISNETYLNGDALVEKGLATGFISDVSIFKQRKKRKTHEKEK